MIAYPDIPGLFTTHGGRAQHHWRKRVPGQSVQGLLQAWILLEKTWHDGCTAMKHILLPCPSLHWWRLSDAVEGQEAIEGPCFLWKEKIHIHANDLDVMWQNKELSVFMTNSWAASPGGLHDTRPVAFSRKASGTSLLVLSWIATCQSNRSNRTFPCRTVKFCSHNCSTT